MRSFSSCSWKVISGDDDLPRRVDIGERRRKHELQVLAGAGVKSEDDLGDEDGNLEANGGAVSEDSESEESADEFYKQVKQQRAAKLAAKAEMYSRDPAIPSLPETVDGKRHITYQMEKNRGLICNRKKQTKSRGRSAGVSMRRQWSDEKGKFRRSGSLPDLTVGKHLVSTQESVEALDSRAKCYYFRLKSVMRTLDQPAGDLSNMSILIVKFLQLHKNQSVSNGNVRGRLGSPSRYVLPIIGRPFLLLSEDWSFA